MQPKIYDINRTIEELKHVSKPGSEKSADDINRTIEELKLVRDTRCPAVLTILIEPLRN